MPYVLFFFISCLHFIYPSSPQHLVVFFHQALSCAKLEWYTFIATVSMKLALVYMACACDSWESLHF